MNSIPENKEAFEIIKKIKVSKTPEKIIDSIKVNLRKNIIIREYLNTIPTKTQCNESDFLILCLPGKYVRELKFEEQKELIDFIKENKSKYRFTIYTSCDKGYNYEGISLSPWWKYRTCNKYSKCLIYLDPFYLSQNINCGNIFFKNNYSFVVSDKVNQIENYEIFK